MSKKSLNRKAAQKFITESRDNGKTDQEIYNELAQQYYDKKSLALLITGTVTNANKNRYKVYNNILITLLAIVIVLRILSVFSLTIQTGQLWTLLLVLFVPIFAAYFAYEIARYNAPVYRFCGIMMILGFFQTMGNADDGTSIRINLALTIAIVSLAFYLDSKLFPHYSPRNLKQDSNGEYILEQV
jgi:glucan phosphoethanolaminetransferase (alkaline phosphatase superfamily)